ncbi:hypothetical protein SAMN04487852_105209 [Prevotella sp. tf2-5]|nr:hypothetical protein SAMN04487852_105209 [Prevotella sp. tf2-5]
MGIKNNAASLAGKQEKPYIRARMWRIFIEVSKSAVCVLANYLEQPNNPS